jgi:hypothetical protein
MRIENLALTQASLDEVVSLFERAAEPAVRHRPEHWRPWVEYHLTMGPAYCAWHDGKLVGAGGMDIRRAGVGRPWIILDGTLDCLPNGRLPTAESLSYLVKTLSNVKTMMHTLCEVFQIRRLHTDSYKDFPASQRLLEFLGFTRLRRETSDRFFYVKDFATENQGLATEDTESTEKDGQSATGGRVVNPPEADKSSIANRGQLCLQQ